jgi:chromosome partitioning protein
MRASGGQVVVATDGTVVLGHHGRGSSVRSIAVINQKGGCGKTTTAINLAAALARMGHKTLLVDMDPQSHCALGLAVPEQQIEYTIADAMLADPAKLDAGAMIWQISSMLDLAPSTVALAGVEQKLSGSSDRDLRLARVLRQLRDRYDLCIIDCPPAVGLLTFNALRAAGEVIIPVETGYFALKGAVKQATTLRVLAERCEHRVAVHVLPTLYDVRTKMSREILADLHKQFGHSVVPVPIHYNSKLKEAAGFGQPIGEYDPASKGAQDFERLARYLLEHAPVETAEDFRSSISDLRSEDTTTGVPQSRSQPIEDSRSKIGDAPAPVSRAAELVQRAKALAERTAALSKKFATDPDVIKVEAQDKKLAEPIADPARKATLDQKLEKLYGVRQSSQGVLFVQPLGKAKQLGLAGDFNGWNGAATPMRKNEHLGVWECCLPLDSGRYRYRLVVDGQWTSDPHNKYVEANPFGELNNIIEVG